MISPYKSLAIISISYAFIGLAGCHSEPAGKELALQDWPSDLATPIPGATFSMSEKHLPGAPREYRAGIHQGFDFFNGLSGRPLAGDEPVVAIADGEIVRIDRAYEEPAVEKRAYYAEISAEPGFIGEFALDQLRGRQVWIRHETGHVSRYAHLSEVHPELQPGDAVQQGQAIGLMGSTGVPPTEDQPSPAPRLSFELWSADGKRYLGKDRTPLAAHRLVASLFSPDALPRYAREVVSAVENGEPWPEPYPPKELPETGFTATPPSEVTAGQAFAAPITWEDDDFLIDDFFAQLEGQPLGILDAGDGAWIIGGIPMETGGQEFRMTIGAVNAYGQTLAGERTIQSRPPDDAPLPAEVDRATFELYSEENLEVEAKHLGPVILQSLGLVEPHWTRPFRPPLEGDVVGLYGQRIFNGMLRPAHPRPGIWIRPEAPEEIVASNAGIVALAEDLPIRGKTVAIIHGGGITSVYSQLDRLTVDKGEKVVHGQALGIIERQNPGPNGAIRWEIYAGGFPVEPTSWLGQMLPERNP